MEAEQATGMREFIVVDMVGEQAVVADAMEAFGEDVEQEAADELIDIEVHGFMV